MSWDVFVFLFFSEEQGSSIDTGGRIPRPAQPLPREETEDQEEKARLIAQVLELQNTLDGHYGIITFSNYCVL